jgi:hypothetical protein
VLDAYLPAAHSKHAEEPVAEAYFPIAHIRHEEERLDEYLPASQDVQPLAAAAIPLSENVPAGQSVHADAVAAEKVPAGQPVHVEAPGLLNVPPEHPRQMVCPSKGWYRPAAQSSQDVDDCDGCTVPAWHFVHSEAPDELDISPTSHAVQLSCPVAG